MKVTICKSLQSSVYFFSVLLGACLLLTAPCSVLAGEIVISASLNNTTFPVDEAVLLSVTVNGASSATPAQPTGKGLEFTYRGQSTQMQWINGTSSSTIIFTYMVQADNPGKHTIDPIRVVVAGKEYTSQPLHCTVLPATSTTGVSQGNTKNSQSSPAARLRSGDAEKIGFMRVTPSQKTLYPGQLVPVVISAYFRQGMRVTLNSNPRLAGNDYILHSLDEKPVQLEKQIKGESYVELRWNGTISPIKEGTFPLEFELDATLLVRVNNSRRNDPFGSLFGRDPFLDDFFARYTKRTVKLASPKQQIVIKPLPQSGRPAGFKGAIGTFGLAVAAAPLTGKVGDPITLTMVVSGTGNFDLVEAPSLKKTTEWKTYPATGNFVEAHPGQGKKTFEQAIVPLTAEINSIPEVEFSFFDPDLGEYVTLHSDPIPLSLQHGNSQTTAPAKNPTDIPETKQKKQPEHTPDKLIPLYTEPGTFVQALVPLYKKPVFLLIAGISTLLLFLSLPVHLRRKKLEQNPEILLQKKLTQSLTDHYHHMEKTIRNDDPANFIQHCQQAIQEYLSLQWGVASQAITYGDIIKKMDKQTPVAQLFARIEQAQFSGSQLGRNEMQEMLATIKEELKA